MALKICLKTNFLSLYMISIYLKLLVCSPSPQTGILFSEFNFVNYFLHNAAGAFSLPPSNVPRGP